MHSSHHHPTTPLATSEPDHHAVVRHIAHHIWTERRDRGSTLEHWFEAEMRVTLLSLVGLYRQTGRAHREEAA